MTKDAKSKKSLAPTRRQFVATSAAAATTAFFLPRLARADDAEFTIKLGTTAPAGTPWEKALKRWRKRVKEATGGRVKIKAYWGAALGDELSVANRTARGSVQCYGGSAGGLSQKVPELECLELPYLFPTMSKADKALDAIYNDVDALLNSRGLKMLFWSENGERSIGLKGGFVKSPSDLKGKKMRSQQTDAHLNMWRGMGASPVPMPVTEVLSGLQTGVVDGFDNTPLFTFAASWYQGIDHYTVTRHSYQPGVIVMNKDFWDSMPKDIQEALLGDHAAEAAYHRKKVRAMNPILINNFGAAGVKVHKSTDAERKAFANATRSAHGKFKKKQSGKGAKLLGKIEKAM